MKTIEMKEYINYANITAVILWVIGRVIKNEMIVWTGVGIMTLTSIWSLIHWKENDKKQNYITIGFLVLVAVWITLKFV